MAASQPLEPGTTLRATPYPAEKARQGRIVLNTPLRRGIFLSGLVGSVLLAIAAAVLL
jgi:hypothetical protein